MLATKGLICLSQVKRLLHQFRSPRRWLGLMLTILVLVLICRLPVVANTPLPYSEIESPPLKEVQMPDYERYELDNGMVVYLMENRELPLVGGRVMIQTGSRLEPPGKTGLAELTGTVLRSGGTHKHSADELNQMLEQRAASIETEVGKTYVSADFNALSEDLDLVFKLFAEVLRYPAFAPEPLQRAKIGMRGGIASRNDDPEDIVWQEFQKQVYGANSPYARTVEYETLDNISRQDAIDFYQKYFRPDRIILGIVGDFDSRKMKARIEESFRDWQPPADASEVSVPKASQKVEGGIFSVDLPHLTQSYIELGHIGVQFDDPDYPALKVLNEVISGLGGRLFNEVRSRQGLAYFVYGDWEFNYDYRGLFNAGGQTRSSTTVPFVESIMSELKRLRREPITEAELKQAKESVLNSFVFNLSEPKSILSRLMRYEYYGYREDFLFEYRRAVEEITAEDLLQAAKKHLQPDRMITVVVGNKKEIKPDLSSLGSQVQPIDVSIPEPSSN